MSENFSFGEIGWPTRIRPYAEEVAIQSRRRYYRENEVVWDWPEEACWLPDMSQEVYAGEEVPDVLIRAREVIAASEDEYWRRRRNPERAQHDAQEPDMCAVGRTATRKETACRRTREGKHATRRGNGSKEREKKGEKEGKGRKERKKEKRMRRRWDEDKEAEAKNRNEANRKKDDGSP